jgi:imidazolonepropionase-like amidohydrolase
MKKLIVVAIACCTFATAQKPAKKASSTKQAATQTSAAPQSGPIVLRGGKLLTITHGAIEDGVLVMENGKITAVGKAGSVNIPRGAKIEDVRGMTVYPGLIDSETNLGLTEISAEKMTNDLVETSDEIMPHMHVADAFHAESSLIPVTRYNGITNAIVAPADEDTLPGQDAFIQLAGRNASEMLLMRDNALPMNFTGSQRRNESFEHAKYPQTREGMAAQLRQTFIDAQAYKKKWDDYNASKSAASDKDKKEEPKTDLKLDALVPYLEAKKPVIVEANEANDVETAYGIAKEFGFKIVLDGVTHASAIVDEIASWHVPVIFGSIYDEPHDNERYDAVYALPGELAKRGVKVIFASHDSHNARNLPYAAGYAVAFGLPYDEALKGVTLYPAELWGVDNQLGSLDVGKTANVVVANGDPLDVKTDVKQVYIQGQPIPMVTKQTILRDQYQ